MTIADERTSDAQRTPLSSSAHPSAWSIEYSPGPIAASATATVASVSSNSQPPRNPFGQTTVAIAFSITVASRNEASGVRKPPASNSPPPSSESPTTTASIAGLR
jgi:hypothetical protein